MLKLSQHRTYYLVVQEKARFLGVSREVDRCKTRDRNYVDDEGRPLEAGLQEQASNHLELRRSRDVVVSVKEKAETNLLGEAHGDERKRTVDEVSKGIRRCRNQDSQDDSGTRLDGICLRANRHPAYRRREHELGVYVERENLSSR